MIVELAGLPGSGKSSIARRLSGPAGGARSIPLIRLSFAKVARHPGAASRALWRWGVLHPGVGWPAWLSLCVRRLAQDRVFPATGPTRLLVEGVVHHTWRTLFRHPGLQARPWDALLETGPPLVVLVASPATRHARLAGKPFPGPVNRQLASRGIDDPAWQRADALFATLLAAVGRRRRVLPVSSEGDIDAAVRRVREAIEAVA